MDAGNSACGRDRVARARAEALAGNHRAAFALLREAVTPDDCYVDQARAARALAALDLGALPLRPLPLALVAGSTLEHFAPVLRLWLARAGFAAEFMLTPFDTAAAAVLDPDSALYRFRPDIVWLFGTHRD
ncbi:MAG: hypothetical protein ACM3JG_11095, partial [Thiohalocapsa sp.]